MWHVRPLAADDRPSVVRLAHACGAFNEAEERVCVELVDEVLGGSEEYAVAVAEDESRMCGFLIYGFDTIAQGVWEVYWIVTDPACQRTGVGSGLLAWMEARLRGTARMVLIETSGQPAYHGQRRFYERNGYVEAARIRDFYKPGDDLVVYRKDLAPLLEGDRGRVAEAAR